MRALANNKDNGRAHLKTTWYIICGFSAIQCLVAIITAAFNSQSEKGYKSASFAAIWDMFLLMGFVRAAFSIVFQNKSSELVVGCMMGMAYMLAQLFFVLMVVFFIFGGEADINNPGKANVERTSLKLVLMASASPFFLSFFLSLSLSLSLSSLSLSLS